MEIVCSGCGSGLKLDERTSTRTGRLIYACKRCRKMFSPVAEHGGRLVEEKLLSHTEMTGTIRMRAVKAGTDRGAPAAGHEVPLTLPDGMTLALEVNEGPIRGHVYQLDRRLVVIGREEGEVRIPDPMISRRHASLEVHVAEVIILRDLSSTNGTYHNERLIAFCKVKDGDEIRVGSTKLTVSVDMAG